MNLSTNALVHPVIHSPSQAEAKNGRDRRSRRPESFEYVVVISPGNSSGGEGKKEYGTKD